MALATLGALVRVVEGGERELMLRALLMAPWEAVRRASGLPVTPAQAVETLVAAAPAEVVDAALRAMIFEGRESLAAYAKAAVFPEQRAVEGFEIEIGAATARRLGVSPQRLVIDRMEMAIAGYGRAKWGANLRPAVPAWLALAAPDERGERVRALIERVKAADGEDSGAFVALGLADWAGTEVAHPGAEAVLALVLAGRSGALRKGGVDLAAAMGRWAVLERVAGEDADAAVRKRAAKQLAARK
ncbi:MAG: hypothetical protein R3F59_11810 [Myxococcota bacterium]